MKRLLIALTALCLTLLVGCDTTPKRVLIIGDSISIGYTPHVATALEERALVTRHQGNARDTANGLANIDEWLGEESWDVIHFNFGLHDLCYRHPDSKAAGQRDKTNGSLPYPIEQYEENLEAIVQRLKETGAELIFATITYVPPFEVGRFPEDVAKYNAVAIEVMERNKITINPLYELSVEVHAEHGKGAGDVHYHKEGYEELSQQVVEYIRKKL